MQGLAFSTDFLQCNKCLLVRESQEFAQLLADC